MHYSVPDFRLIFNVIDFDNCSYQGMQFEKHFIKSNGMQVKGAISKKMNYQKLV